MSLEKKKTANKETSKEMIIALKTGLIGPVARIGDTLIRGILKPICPALAAAMVLSNSPIGASFVLLFPLAGYFIGYYMCHSGYSLGHNAISKLIQNGLMNQIIDIRNILGLMMMGTLSASFVSLTIAAGPKLENSNPTLLQNILDGITSGLLPFAVITSIYFYTKERGIRHGGILIGIIIASLILSFFGIVQTGS